ncbi:membrane integrity-associated transporter subunit PqiC [Nitrosovibrio sp. Nv6]|uniref:PqiC family protein n=1 Tax=Nitrosovibrio sp. Nv6 TaxID=1855340 RepID=UPI0008AF594A|nr:PqiC family protein [Nitrosovibrio sp. Nv6]SEO69566.1 hypothetical protein SAMN05216316_0824 [Nitrosovibrio sp. Nv6]
MTRLSPIMVAIMTASMAALWAAGCASIPETRFYTLSAPFRPPSVEDGMPRLVTPAYIEVMPVSVPERLARPQLVVRSQGSGQETQLFVLEQDRWASHFNDELRDAFAAGIAGQTGAISETRRAHTPDQPVYRIAIELSQFDALVGERVKARFSWAITRLTDGRSAACYAAISEPVDGGISGVVKGIQRVVSTAVEDVSKNLIEMDTGHPVTCKPYKTVN